MIAQVFYVLYKAITSDLIKGNEEANKSTKGLAKELKEQDKHTENLKKGFKSLAVEIAGALGVAYTAGEFFRSLKDAADFGKTLSINSNLMNINAGELQAWGNIAQKVGGTAQGFQADIGNIAAAFNTTKDNAFRLIPYLVENFSKLNRMQSQAYGHGFLNISDETIALFKKGGTELTSMLEAQKELGLITENDVKKFSALNNSVVDTKNAFMGLTVGLVSDAIPGLNKTFDAITKGLVFLREHKAEVESFFSAFSVFALGAIAAINPPLALLAATITGVIYLLEKLQKYEEKTPSAGQNLKANGQFYGNTLTDMLTGHMKFEGDDPQKHLEPVHGDEVTAKVHNLINNAASSSKSTTINNNVKIEKVVANNPTELVRNIKSASGFSPAFMDQTGQANNAVADGMQ